jgi:hypothetical protein
MTGRVARRHGVSESHRDQHRTPQPEDVADALRQVVELKRHLDLSGKRDEEAAQKKQHSRIQRRGRPGETARRHADLAGEQRALLSIEDRRAAESEAQPVEFSIIKQVRMNDRVRAQFHVEFLNAFDRTVYANPNTDPTNADFGKVTSQTNLPRDIQLAMKLVF